MKTIKTRFAPSPTGYLHIGSLRTALYCYLFARKHQGIFALRIEDTDQNRFVEGATENLMEILEIFGLNWDEGPIFQSKRTEIYQGYAQELLQKGRAYKCYCSPDELEKMRAEQVAKGQTPKYDGRCSHLSQAEHEERFKAGKNFVIRLKMPQSLIQFDDAIRGHVEFHGKDIDDQVLIKSDGFPTYHLANVVDDHEMEITHVIRGEEWLSSTPKHVALYDAFGWEAPQFAHLPLLLNSDRSKLSKRQGDVAAEDYLKKGYLPKAILNFIAFQGWNPGSEKEFFSMEELIEAFDLDRVQKAGAVFTVEKLDWYNGHYLREMPLLELAEQVRLACVQAPWWPQSFAPTLTKEDLVTESRPEASDFLRYTACIQTRMKTLQDSAPMMKSFFLKDFAFDRALFLNEKMGVDAGAVTLGLEQSLACLQNASPETFASEEALKNLLVSTIKSLGVKNGVLLWPLRIALSNEMYSPGATEILHILGQNESLRRLEKALAFWKN